ncbi:MAG: gamma-glutamyltransferase [Chromatiales bacterium]|nr:gamma-glutamyltransferase [Chromatiales bacterium]MDH4013853.1 gamma-glutamyltransferase [Chromatiales bacterium]
MRMSIVARVCAAVVLVGVTDMADGFDRQSDDPFASRSEVIAPHGMAATSQPLATQIALDILKAGGSAVDAAIAANAALGLMEPTGCGIGGDLFAIVWDGTAKRLHGLNASGRSPRALSLKYFREQGLERIPERGPLPVSVPGAVDGWFELHARFGRLPMEELLAPAIAYARHGFPVTEVIAWHWARNAKILQGYPGFAEVFMPAGKAPAKGEVFRNPRLADTYRKIAEGGRDAFYRGEIAATIERYLSENGGFLSAADLADHKSEWVEPLSSSYRGYEVWELPPNGQGIAALQMLNILEDYDIAAMGFGSADYLHVLVETKKLVYADRARYYTDPQFEEVPVDWLLSADYAAQRRGLIDMRRAADAVEAGAAPIEHGDTIYLAVADREGNMVSLIQSNFSGMGSGMTPPGLGFILQNRGELFSLDPVHANVYAPGKRPFHTIIPAFVTRAGEPWLAFGVMGGAMQPQGHVQVLVNMVDFGMNLQQAGDAPRIRHVGSAQPTGEHAAGGGEIWMESGFDAAVIAELQRRGHRTDIRGQAYGGYQAIARDRDNGVWVGASESRKDGHAAGY